MTEKKPTDASMLKSVACYGKLNVGYNSYVLPYEEAIAAMKALKNVEAWNTELYSSPKITPMSPSSGEITLTILSRAEYLKCKMAHLLDVPSEEL